MLTRFKLHQIFLANIVIIFIALVLLMLGVSYYAAKQIDISAQKTHMVKSLALAKEILHFQKDETALQAYVENIKSTTGYRATIIDIDGGVLAESDKNRSEMDNHINRPEIVEAMTKHSGFTIRYSASLERDLVYSATKTKIGQKEVFLRLSNEIGEYENHLHALWQNIGMVFLAALSIAVFFSYRINTKIQEQISAIAYYLQELENKNFDASLKPSFAEEFYLISNILTSMCRKLEKQESQKKKYTTKLKIKNRQATDIIEAIAHEFKNPVAAVMGYTETIMNDEEMDPKIRQKFLGKAYTNAQMISKMIDRLSLSLKLENNSIEINPERFRVMSVLEESKEQLLQKYKKRIIDIECDEIHLFADRTLIQLVIVNLMENALKYSENEVLIRAIKRADAITVEVIDCGMGIHEKDLESITKKFYRVSKNGWDNSLGLGLSLVRYVLKIHGSDLIVNSTLAVGSTFSFVISDYKKIEPGKA